MKKKLVIEKGRADKPYMYQKILVDKLIEGAKTSVHPVHSNLE